VNKYLYLCHPLVLSSPTKIVLFLIKSGIFIGANDTVIYSFETKHLLVINTLNLATYFGSLNHLQVNP